MSFQKGQSGNPGGRKREKAFADALNIALKEQTTEGKIKLRVIAEKLVDCACAGEPWAVQQVADRIDGKPAQEAVLTIDNKRDSIDWTRDELVAYLNNAKNGSNGAAEANGRDREPDSVH